MRRLLLALVAALLVGLLVSAPALAATATDTLTGVEVFPGVIQGNVRYGASFVGQATGSLPGWWLVAVNYTPPQPGPSVTNQLVGGYWALAVYEGGQYRGSVYGTVTGGSAVWNAAGTVAALTATLTIAGGSGAYAGTSGSGTFAGALSHLTFPPTIQGTLTLSY